MKQTHLLYLEDSYQSSLKTEVLEVKELGNRIGVTLAATVLYPQGGGQPSDHGVIIGANGTVKVKEVTYNDGSPLHIGNLEGTLTAGETVTIEVDWPRRYRHMQAHTAGHLLDEAVKEVLPEFHGIKGSHGIGDEYYITFNGFIDSSHKPQIESALTAIIKANEPIVSRLVTKADIEAEHIFIPFTLPENKPLRLITIGDRLPVPDGGTQLKSTGETWPIKIGEVTYEDGNTTIQYEQKVPKQTITAQKPDSLISLEDFTAKTNDVIASIRESDITDAQKVAYLGKKGKVNEVAALIRNLSPEDRAAAGQVLNKMKNEVTSIISTALNNLQSTTTWVDVTAPGEKPEIGHLHPMTQAIEEITHIFETIGFTRVRYPEVDYDWYAFESLNMPKKHPARDEWETFFIDTPKHPQYGGMVLSPHTSSGQVREMERVGKPPIRMLNIAKCYRRQQDVTHTAMFHQFEGLVVDKGINIQHLKGTLDYFAQKFYGPSAKSRIRPFMFKFTEPSFEVDFSCVHCSGKGCRFCKSGWHEVGGAGMVHPNVLKAGGIDPEEYTGFAFGWGIERVYTLKPGLKLDDIRPLYGNNLEFLAQF